MTELKRSLSVWGATSIGIGAIIGAGIFVISGVASGFAGPAVILSFIIAGIVSFLTALSSAELSRGDKNESRCGGKMRIIETIRKIPHEKMKSTDKPTKIVHVQTVYCRRKI